MTGTPVVLAARDGGGVARMLSRVPARATLLLILSVVPLASGCRAKDDAPIDIPFPSDTSGAGAGSTPGAGVRPAPTATSRPQDPKRPATAPSSTEAPDPASSGVPTAKPKATGRPISTQL